MSTRSAVITGITGQDGSYLADFLLAKGYEVHGIVRRSSTFSTERINQHIDHPRLHLHYGDLTDGSSLRRVLEEAEPDEVYNLGAQSHVRVSFDTAEFTGDVTGLGTVRLLEALRKTGLQVRFYQASSSELFGKVVETPQRETTPFHPRSPYGCAKAYAFYIVQNYREAYNLFAANGILFNHESERRGETFVSRKITRAVGRIKRGLQDKLSLGNLDAQRDWGYAPDYVEAMWLMLQHDQPEDFVIGTGRTHSVRDFVSKAFACADLDWERYVEFDERYVRPSEVDLLLADASKAKFDLNWEPKVSFDELVRRMVDHDLNLAAREAHSAELDV